ncbi:MOSC domain-containing protein [Streptomyces sp. NBC_00569]|uniref:MOSC domain-containing protein n=1 Tax=unclassified Streptomyces TaxID=2593676 RepID=UPI0022599FE4|nr:MULTISPECIES: MOSC domain-containing protein [unclassified Streptomyces]MCX5439096.1 MOSC domain-containing protein [Streptomyces sp. NBC_00063]WUB94409.1 MOSC domain-containing protein [Streptomyces sp. NBC_00569]
MKVLSLNVGRPEASEHTDQAEGVTGIDKRPVPGPVRVAAPGPKGIGASGLEGDAVCDMRHHGGDDQAVYAFAREDLDEWQGTLGHALRNGSFGENLTTEGVDVSGAKIGERWRVGPDLVLEVASGRIPCRTFQGHLAEKGWVRRFTARAAPGAYLRVIEPGAIRAGDTIEIVHRPDHEVTVAFQFRAVTTDRGLLPRLLVAADALAPEAVEAARTYVAKYGGGDAV